MGCSLLMSFLSYHLLCIIAVHKHLQELKAKSASAMMMAYAAWTQRLGQNPSDQYSCIHPGSMANDRKDFVLTKQRDLPGT